MSLVNEMLSDLDGRRSADVAANSQLEFLSPEKKPVQKTLLPYLIALVVILLGIILWQLYQPSMSTKKEGSGNLITNPVAFIPVDKQSKRKINPRVPVVTKKVSASVTKNTTKAPAKNIKEKPAEPTEKKPIVSSSAPKVEAINQQGDVSPQRRSIVKTVLPLSAERIDEKVMADAARLIALGERGRAEQKLSRHLLIDDKAIHSGSLLVSLLIEEQRLAEAQVVINDLWVSSSKNVGLVMLQARLYLLVDDAAKAVDVQRELQPLLADNLPYYELLALASQQAGQYGLSARVYAALLDFDDRKGSWWVGFAIANDKQGQYGVARKAYRQVLLKKDVSQPLKEYASKRFSALAGL